jgi:hypothetical protein
VLVGYHARFFKSLKAKDFLNWGDKSKGAQADVQKRLSKLSSPVVTLSRTDEAFREVFNSLASAFAPGPCRERLRRQCALFRFVDALDVTASRNPAEFLIGADFLPPKQYEENLKRELCDSAMIDRGNVNVVLKAFPPDFESVMQAIQQVQNMQPLSDEEAQAVEEANAFLEKPIAKARIAEPWAKIIGNGDMEEKLKKLKDSAMCLQKPLDRWLKEAWTVIMGNQGNESFATCLKNIGVLDTHTLKSHLTLPGAKIIASVTALAVAGELLDEYQAIVEGELDQQLRLGTFGWAKEADWSNGLPRGLTTLQKALGQASSKTSP